MKVCVPPAVDSLHNWLLCIYTKGRCVCVYRQIVLSTTHNLHSFDWTGLGLDHMVLHCLLVCDFGVNILNNILSDKFPIC